MHYNDISTKNSVTYMDAITIMYAMWTFRFYL